MAESTEDDKVLFGLCRPALKRMVALVVDEDGDNVDANGDTENQRRLATVSISFQRLFSEND